MSRYEILLTGCLLTKVTTSVINRYTEENDRGEKVSTVAKITKDMETASTVGLIGLGLLRVIPKLF